MSGFPQADPIESGWIPIEKDMIKKKIPLIYTKRELQKEQGFVSLIPISEDNYLVQLNGNGTLNVSAWVNGVEQTQFVSDDSKFRGENILGKDISIQLKDAPRNIELRITYKEKTISYFPFK